MDTKISKTFLITALGTLVITACAPRFPTTGWPIDATNTEHELGNSGGEFQEYGNPPYFHAGIDILEVDAPTGPWVRNTRSGTVSLSLPGAGSLYNGMTMTHDDGDVYLYWHLDFNSIQQAVLDAATLGTTLASESQISQLVTWTACDFHHLHYEISDSTGTLDPIFTLTPRNDTSTPTIVDVHFVENTTSVEYPLSGTTPVLDGDVDVIVHANDTQFGTNTTGVMELSYRVNDPSNGALVKSSTTVRFDNIPADTNAGIIYRTVTPFESSSDYCGIENSYYVLTNVDSNGDIISDASGLWDTTTLANGIYDVTVTIEDQSGNSSTMVQQVEIAN